MLFVTHTSLESEMPSYVRSTLARPARWAGRRLDVALVRRAPRTLAVSPLLARMLGHAAGREVHALSLPWSLAAPISEEERSVARRALAIGPAERVLSYAGNLDGYQGLAPMLSGVARLTQPVHLLIATCAPHVPVVRELASRGITRVTFTPLADEAERRRVHAAADLALVPRRSPGGVPIKLLDALARGVPIVAAERALAELPLAHYCAVVDGDSAESWAAAISHGLATLAGRRERAERARTCIARDYAPARFVRCFEAHVAALRRA